MNKYIGIKNKIKDYQYIIITFFAIFTALTTIWWIIYIGEYNLSSLINNGVEVEAEIVDVCYEYVNPDSESTIIYYNIYLYVSPEGKEYSGTCGPGGSRKYAESFIGQKVTIVIDPNGTESICGKLGDWPNLEKNVKVNFILTRIFTCVFCVTAYLFFYRVIYRKTIDKKILKRLESGSANCKISTGEVAKTLGLLWFYVKIKYQDENGRNQVRWAREWFTRKEAKFLKQQKFINIVLYKNTYGILEEMPIKK